MFLTGWSTSFHNPSIKNSNPIVRNIAALVLREGCSKGTYVLLSILIARRYGKELLGQYALALLIPRLFFTVSDMGLNTLLTRNVAKSRQALSLYMVNLTALRALLGLLTLLLLIAFAYVVYPARPLFRLLCLSGLSYFVLNFITLINAAFRSFEKMTYEARILISRDILFLLSALLWLAGRQSLGFLFFYFLICNTLALGYAVWLYRNFLGPPLASLDVAFCRKSLQGARPIWLITLFSLLYLYVDSVLLSVFKGEAVVGLYNATFMFVEPFILAATILTTAFFPIFSRVSHNPTELRQTYTAVFKLAFFCGLPFQLGFLTLAGQWLRLFYGPSFLEATAAFRILMTGGVLFAIGSVNAHCLMACGDEAFVAKGMAAFLLLNLLLNLWWIPPLSFVGSSLATVVCEGGVFLVFLLRIRSHAGIVPLRSFLGKLGMAGSAMAIACWMSQKLVFPASFGIGLVVYLLVDLLGRGYLWQERTTIASLWKELQTSSG